MRNNAAQKIQHSSIHSFFFFHLAGTKLYYKLDQLTLYRTGPVWLLTQGHFVKGRPYHGSVLGSLGHTNPSTDHKYSCISCVLHG